MQKQSMQWLIPVLLAIGAAAALWYYWSQLPEPQAGPPASPVPVEPAELLGPLHPIDQGQADAADADALVPLPPLDQSDEYFKLSITNIFGTSIEGLLAKTGMIERVVATIDNLPRAHVAERLRPLNPLPDQFLVHSLEAGGEITISPDNYRRYDVLVNVFTSADLAEVTDVYRRFYPLFQRAYVGLGYPNGYFNDRLVEVIDHLLATPQVSDPVALVRPHVLYEYQDASLEALSSGQKLMLRMGPDHSARIREKLRQLRALITSM